LVNTYSSGTSPGPGASACGVAAVSGATASVAAPIASLMLFEALLPGVKYCVL
jgi:hypothetical protein